MRVIFSKVAEISYDGILEFLSDLWTEKEMNIFINDVEKIVKYLENGKYLQFQKSEYNTRSALIGKKHVRMFFKKEKTDIIKVLLFFDMRQDYHKILELLKQ